MVVFAEQDSVGDVGVSAVLVVVDVVGFGPGCWSVAVPDHAPTIAGG
jgi:hypothetical protein